MRVKHFEIKAILALTIEVMVLPVIVDLVSMTYDFLVIQKDSNGKTNQGAIMAPKNEFMGCVSIDVIV